MEYMRKNGQLTVGLFSSDKCLSVNKNTKGCLDERGLECKGVSTAHVARPNPF